MASPGVLGASLPSPSKTLPLDKPVTPPRKAARPFSLSGTLDDPHPLPAKRQKVKEERDGSSVPGSCEAMEVMEEVEAKALTEAEPGTSSPGAEGGGGAALSQDDDAPKQRSVVPTS